MVTVSYLMEKNTSCKFWTSYQERRYTSLVLKPLTFHNLKLFFLRCTVRTGEDLLYKIECYLCTIFHLFYSTFLFAMSRFHFSSNRSLSPLLQRWGLKCESVSLESVQGSSLSVKLEGPSPNKLDTNHTIQLWEITR